MKKNLVLGFTVLLVASLPAIASGGGSGGGGGGGGSSSGGSSGGGGSAGASGGGSGSDSDGSIFTSRSVNIERALLGESVFTGTAEIAPKVISRSLYQKQGKSLVRMKKVVDRARLLNGGRASDTSSIYNQFNPKELAGRLSPKQMSALRYYVKLKFPRS